jgi:GlcNAc-P-P-Und epimerase
MMNIVGGSGFIGSRLSKLLSVSNVPFRIIDKVKSSAFPENSFLADVRSIDSLIGALFDGEVLINLAAEHRDDIRPITLYDEVNVLGAKNLCEAARKRGIQKIIFISSVAVYGFAPLGTNETGKINPFNDYGRTKAEAELVFKSWQAEDSSHRTLAIIRPTVVFGEQNRGNVYNLLNQMATGRFMMIGNGNNLKSMAYVENVAAFIIHSIGFPPGLHIFNYVDKPDFTMNSLVVLVRKMMGKTEKVSMRLPYSVGLFIGKVYDFLSWLTGKRFAVSSIRVKKFCANTMYETSIGKSGFTPPVLLEDALSKTIKHEFLDKDKTEGLFFSE